LSGGYLDHGYGSHRRESFARYYRRNMVSEGCGCGERVLDPANRPNDPVGLLRLVAWLAGRLRRPGHSECGTENADGPAA